MFQSGDTVTNWLFLGVSISGLLLAIGFFMKRSDGLFFSRTITQYKRDKNNPEYERERYVGKTTSEYILKYIPPVFMGFLMLLILKAMHLI